MRGVVAQQFQRLVIAAGDDRDLGIAVDDVGGVDQPAIDLAGERGFRQAGTDSGGDFHYGYGLLELAFRAVR